MFKRIMVNSFILSKFADGSPSQKAAYTSEDYLKITEEQLKASAAQQQVQSPPQGESSPELQNQPQGISFVNNSCSLSISVYQLLVTLYVCFDNSYC